MAMKLWIHSLHMCQAKSDVQMDIVPMSSSPKRTKRLFGKVEQRVTVSDTTSRVELSPIAVPPSTCVFGLE